MKRFSLFSIWFLISSVFITTAQVQDVKDTFTPYYVTFTKLHGYEDVDKDSWRAVEEEFFNKVTAKNKYIKYYQFLVNFTAMGQPEYFIMKVYKDWNDIHLAEVETNRLIKAAWPNEEKRKAFFERMNKNYDFYYSNSIFRTTRLASNNTKMKEMKGKKKFFYVVWSKLSDYQGDDAVDAYEDYVKGVTYKNPYIRAYLAQRHYYGPDSRDFVEFYVLDSNEDLIKALDKDRELLKEMIPDKSERDAFIEAYNKGITKRTGELYMNVPSLSK
jgi:hypothetical protein